jgi:hypothetical protein
MKTEWTDTYIQWAVEDARVNARDPAMTFRRELAPVMFTSATAEGMKSAGKKPSLSMRRVAYDHEGVLTSISRRASSSAITGTE